jgi:hypothetical protein
MYYNNYYKEDEDRFIPPDELWAEALKVCGNDTLASIGAPLGYHMGESFLNCPRSVFWKNNMWSWANKHPQYLPPKKSEKGFAFNSRDLLGKALMEGVMKNSQDAAEKYYNEHVDWTKIKPWEEKTVPFIRDELCMRVAMVWGELRRFPGYRGIEFEKTFTYPASNGLIYNGAADAVVYCNLGPIFIEIKNTNNPAWVKRESGQIDYYCRLAAACGMPNGGGLYFLLPGWFDGNNTLVNAARVEMYPPEQTRDSLGNMKGKADKYMVAINTLAHIPLQVELWNKPAAPFNRCDTCQARSVCFPEKYPRKQ